jgi:hypothetical protein
MDDDLDTGRAFRAIFRSFARIRPMLDAGNLDGADAAEIVRALRRIDSVLGVFF